MDARLRYVREDNAVRVHGDVLGLALKFEWPEWLEFATGDVTFALHHASDDHPAGSDELGYSVKDLREVMLTGRRTVSASRRPRAISTAHCSRTLPTAKAPNAA